MRAAILLATLLPLASALTPIVIDIEFDQHTLPDLDHSGVGTPVTSRTPFPASSSPALGEEDELQIDWTGEGDTFDPVAYLDAQERGQDSTASPAYVGHQGDRRTPGAPGGMLAAAAGAVMAVV